MNFFLELVTIYLNFQFLNYLKKNEYTYINNEY